MQDKQKYNAVFFDNDGVLVDTECFYFYATRDILSTIGIELTEEMYHELFLVQARGAWHLAREKGYSDQHIAEMKQQRSERYLWYLTRHDILIPGVHDVLERLFGKVLLGVVTSSQRNHFDYIHAKTGLLRFFNFVIAEGDYSHSKPHPEPYLTALERSKRDPRECVVIEDSARGLQSAKSAGLECWVIPRGLTVGSDFSRADRVLSNLSEIITLISG